MNCSRVSPGFYVTYDRNYSYVGIRGFGRPADYNTRMLLLVDGHRINDNIYDSAAIGEEFVLDLDLIDRVEIIRGPSSSLYGANAFFGVINVVTLDAKDFDGFEVSGGAGSDDTYSGRLTYGKEFENGVSALLSGSGYDSEGQTLFFEEFNDPESNDGVARNADAGDFYSWFADLSYKSLSLQAAHNTRNKKIPTASFETVFNDQRNEDRG